MLVYGALLIILLTKTMGHPCVTPNNEPAYCVSLFTCPVLLTTLGSLQPFALDFVKKSLCDPVPEDVSVCCGSLGNFAETYRNTTTRTKEIQNTTPSIPSTPPPPPPVSTKKNFLASRKFCGYQHTDDRFVSDNNSTALDEFPWLVHIVFLDDADEEPEQYLDRCNGVLISNRYVLTTEYCGTFAKSVKLGQYYTNATVTCTENADLKDCTEPVLEVSVEEEIHRVNKTDGWHDFALLRLATKINFSDFVRPICLPLNESEIMERQELVFSGWGATEQGGVRKKRLIYKPTNVSECEKLDDKGLGNVTEITPICLLPRDKNGDLACAGDESGPLLYSRKRSQWFADALITRVYSKLTDINFCSNELPITGIKITMDIVEWIISNMRP
ncbi:hypothetical protein RI129_010659 [Pyrocoelia pectoralis]|uniref:CLIP domain-containing serine protease n=1 Tax=Pyrocoelia pectoralis TaxID=417401 RepID=A0AAN7ZI53_9COLE